MSQMCRLVSSLGRGEVVIVASPHARVEKLKSSKIIWGAKNYLRREPQGSRLKGKKNTHFEICIEICIEICVEIGVVIVASPHARVEKSKSSKIIWGAR